MEDLKMRLDQPHANNHAFPVFQQETQNGSGNCNKNPGLSKMEYFAAAALQGLLSNPNYINADSQSTPNPDFFQKIAMDAANYAYALEKQVGSKTWD